MTLFFDHLVVGARSLGEGVAWVEERVGVAMGAGDAMQFRVTDVGGSL